MPYERRKKSSYASDFSVVLVNDFFSIQRLQIAIKNNEAERNIWFAFSGWSPLDPYH